jgi:hypothetical protein
MPKAVEVAVHHAVAVCCVGVSDRVGCSGEASVDVHGSIADSNGLKSLKRTDCG